MSDVRREQRAGRRQNCREESQGRLLGVATKFESGSIAGAARGVTSEAKESFGTDSSYALYRFIRDSIQRSS